MSSDQLSEGRKCGTCELCCRLLEIQELEKPADTKCVHQTGHGCSVYHNETEGIEPHRPGRCGEFICLWLAGMFANADRPDKIGAVFVIKEQDSLGSHIVCYESHPLSRESSRVKRILENLADKLPVFIMPPDDSDRHLLCNDPERAAKLRPILDKMTTRGI